MKSTLLTFGLLLGFVTLLTGSVLATDNYSHNNYDNKDYGKSHDYSNSSYDHKDYDKKDYDHKDYDKKDYDHNYSYNNGFFYDSYLNLHYFLKNLIVHRVEAIVSKHYDYDKHDGYYHDKKNYDHKNWNY